jgi:pyridoxine/pyridoxamine 5'-phosphate oxidase
MGIDAVISASRARASAFTRELFATDQWDAERVADFVNEQRNATVATVSSAGQPHAAVVIAASVDDEIYFTVNASSVLARNLGDNDRIAVSVCDTRDAVMAQGRAVLVGPALELAELIERLATRSATGRFTPDGWDGDLYRVELKRLVAN